MAERLNSEQPGLPSASEIQRRDFIRLAAGAAALAVSHGSTASAADSAGSDEFAKLTITEASRKIHSRQSWRG